MTQTFFKAMFGPRSRAMQEIDGSRAAHARMEAQAGEIDILTDRELDFIAHHLPKGTSIQTSARTVGAYCANMMLKMEVRTLSKLVLMLIQIDR